MSSVKMFVYYFQTILLLLNQLLSTLVKYSIFSTLSYLVLQDSFVPLWKTGVEYIFTKCITPLANYFLHKFIVKIFFCSLQNVPFWIFGIVLLNITFWSKFGYLPKLYDWSSFLSRRRVISLSTPDSVFFFFLSVMSSVECVFY